MKSMEIKCERCGQKEGQIKKDRLKAGSHRYKRNHCGKHILP